MDQALRDGPCLAEAEDAAFDERPPSIDAAERRLHVRAHNLWVSLLDGRAYPKLADLDGAREDEFAPFAVLLDFTRGPVPAIVRVGDALAGACGLAGALPEMAEVAPHSLLGRLVGEYRAILANRAPIGFEAEFVDGAGATMLYRGILMPFSSDGGRIDFVYGVMRWKALADMRDLPNVAAAALPPSSGAGAVMPARAAAADTVTIAGRFALARAAARRAGETEVHMRAALTDALGHAYDLLLAAEDDPLGCRAAGVPVPAAPRAIVATLFADMLEAERIGDLGDALAHAQRIGVPAGGFARHAESLRGGLRAMVAAERAHIGEPA